LISCKHIAMMRMSAAATRRKLTMASLLVMYKKPSDAVAFDKYYFERHIPLAKKIPGLRKYTVTRGPVMTPTGPADFHLIATLDFDDMAAIQAAFASAEGQATVADVPNFATGGADLLMSDTRTV
jgi:uncharacterized protein (TIGR02118 family)